jgi:hypothetical protein
MNTEDDEFNRIEREASLRLEAVKDTIRYREAFPKDYRLPKPWAGLTNEERNQLWRDVVKWGDPSHDDVDLMKAIEAKLKEKNEM